jgi:hypothetical protein
MDGKMKLQRDPTTVRTNLTVIECAFSSDNAFLSSISWQQRMIHLKDEYVTKCSPRVT